MSVASTATVAPVFASKAIATLPPARRSAMTPEPTTAAVRSSEPIASALSRWRKELIPRGCLQRDAAAPEDSISHRSVERETAASACSSRADRFQAPLQFGAIERFERQLDEGFD